MDLQALARIWTPDVVDDPSFARLLVRRADQLQAVGALRYELFIERDRKAYPFADHSKRIFLEPIDEVSLNFCIAEGDGCLAGIRLTTASDALTDSQLSAVLRHGGISEPDIEAAAICSRMVVAESGRARIMIPGLFRGIYRAGLKAGKTICFICSRPSGTSLFERFGFCQVGGFRDPVAGNLIVLRLNASDRGYLQATKPPYLSVYDELLEGTP